MAVTQYEQKDLEITRDKVELWKRTYCKGASDDEMQLFLHTVKKTGLLPDAKQIYAIKRGGQMTIQVSIDGYRLIAQRSGEYSGQLGPFWCGEDGVWKDVWVSAKPPVAAKVGVVRKGWSEPCWGVAKYDGYAQTYNGKPNNFWGKMPDLMLSKCAEALALRKAFPQELSGIYTHEEMGQAQNNDPMENTQPPQRKLPPIDPEERVRNVIKAFKPYNFELFGLEEALGRPCQEWDARDFTLLGHWLNDLRKSIIPQALERFSKPKEAIVADDAPPPPIDQ